MKCANENQVCTYTQCKKPTGRVFSPEYVELLESKVNLLSSSLSILAEVVSQGEDLSHLAQDPDTPINELVDKLQAMGNKQKKVGSPRFNKDHPSTHQNQNNTVKVSPAKHLKSETGQRSPVIRNTTVRHRSPTLNHKSPSALSDGETPLDFSDTTDSPTFEEPSSFHDYPMPFVPPMSTPQETQPGVSKLMQPPEIRDDFSTSPSLYGTLRTQCAPTGIQNNFDSSFTLSDHPVISDPPYSQASSLAPNNGMHPPRLTPVVAHQSPNTPPFSFGTMGKDDFNDILTDGAEDFLHWQQV